MTPARGDEPTTTPATTPATAPVAAVADDPVAAEVRKKMIRWNKECGTWSLEQMRKMLHTENDREAIYADYVAHECWEEGKTQQVVRDKWGPEIELKFAHIYGTDTIEDDQSAEIKVDGNHAKMAFQSKELTTTYLIKLDGQWILDEHAQFDVLLKDDPEVDKHKIQTARLMKQEAADISAGKFENADAFLTDFTSKYNALTPGN